MTDAYYDEGRVRLFVGDCREIVPALGLTADCLVCDPPYGETSLPWDRWPDGWPAVAAQASRSMWCFGSLRMFLDRRDEFAGWKLSQDVVWEKQQGSGWTTDRFSRVHEQAAYWYIGPWDAVGHEPPRVLYTGVSRTWSPVGPDAGSRAQHRGQIGARLGYTDDGTRLMQSVIRIRNLRQAGALHPCEKPLGILDPLISYACPPGGTVGDMFAGSGSTLVAARDSGRKAWGVEADERFAEVIARRLAQDCLSIGGTP